MAFAAEIRTAHGFAHAAGEPVLRHQSGNSGISPHAPGPCYPHGRRTPMDCRSRGRRARLVSHRQLVRTPGATRARMSRSLRAPFLAHPSALAPIAFRSNRWDCFDLMLVDIFMPHMRGFKMNACGNAKSAAGAPWLRVCVRECRRSQPSGNSSFTVRVACTHAAHQLRNAMRMRRRLRVIQISSRGPCISPDIVRILLRVS